MNSEILPVFGSRLLGPGCEWKSLSRALLKGGWYPKIWRCPWKIQFFRNARVKTFEVLSKTFWNDLTEFSSRWVWNLRKVRILSGILGFHQSCDQDKNRNHSIKNSRIRDMIDDCNMNNVAKNQVSAVFHSHAIRRSASPKFIELFMETPCLCPSEGHKYGGRDVTKTSVVEFCYWSYSRPLTHWHIFRAPLKTAKASGFPG